MSPVRRRRGIVSRLLSGTARQRVEVFHCDVETPGRTSQRVGPQSLNDAILGIIGFDGDGAGPLLMWDGRMMATTGAEARAFFDGNLQRWAPRARRSLDATGMDPLPDDEFWTPLDVLEKRAWQSTLPQSVRTIAAHDREWQLRWAETAGLHALALSSSLPEELADCGLDVRYELSAIGAVLLQGKDVYELVLAGRRRVDRGWLSDLSAQTIWLASAALDKEGLGDTTVETSFSPRHRQILARDRAMDEAHRVAEGSPPEPDSPALTATRAVVELKGEYRERLVWFDDRSRRDEERIDHARAAVESLGGRVVAGPELDREWTQADLWSGEVFRIRRRSNADFEVYAQRFTTPR